MLAYLAFFPYILQLYTVSGSVLKQSDVLSKMLTMFTMTLLTLTDVGRYNSLFYRVRMLTFANYTRRSEISAHQSLRTSKLKSVARVAARSAANKP